MRVHVDQIKCNSNGLCVVKCPEVFRFQEGSKKSGVRLERIPSVLWNKCREVAALCPTGAIVIEE